MFVRWIVSQFESTCLILFWKFSACVCCLRSFLHLCLIWSQILSRFFFNSNKIYIILVRVHWCMWSLRVRIKYLKLPLNNNFTGKIWIFLQANFQEWGVGFMESVPTPSTALLPLVLEAYPKATHVTFFLLLLLACILIGHLFEKKSWLNESITSIAIVSLHLKALSCVIA